MSEKMKTLSRAPQLPSLWSVGAALIAICVVAPVVAVVWFALTPTDNIWPHLIDTVLPRYFRNTLILMTCVGLVTAVTGASVGWLVAMYRFPGRSWLQWALLLPLSVPAYVGAYALVDFLEYAGPVQTALRSTFGFETLRDYWFPNIRSMTGAVIVISAAYFPYVYILSRAAFREQSLAGYEVARILGAGPVQRFLRVGVPMARPAIAAGAAVVMMETVNDFGTVDYFAIQTLTTGIFTAWQQGGNLGSAAQIATSVLILIAVLVTFEKISRSRMRHTTGARNQRPVVPTKLRGWRACVAFTVCLLPFLIGFIFPVAVLVGHAFDGAEWLSPGLFAAMVRTVTVGLIAALITVLAALFMVYGVRLSGKALPRMLMPLTALGYAAPGAVLALGILVPLATIDNALADTILAITGTDPGLLLLGSGGILVFAYVVRFFAIGMGTTDAALGRVPNSLPMAARLLGETSGGVLRKIHAPLMRASLGSAFLLVFVDCVKELPATIMLSFEPTLATRVHAKASLELINEAAPAALIIVAVGLVAVTLLARANR